MKERRLWLITDTHFNHDALVRYCGRPPDFTRRIIKNCRQLLAPTDVLIHLGDVIFSNAGQLDELLAEIPGTKILVKGNHDKRPDSWFYNKGFSFVCDAFRIEDVIFSHIPLPQLPPDVRLNVHGHFHNTDHRRHEPEIADYYDDEKHRLLALEHTDYKPVLLREFCA